MRGGQADYLKIIASIIPKEVTSLLSRFPQLRRRNCRRVRMSRAVLLVDDESLVREVAASMLEDLGCEMTTATGAIEALEKLSTRALRY